MAFKLTEASSSDWAPLQKRTPGKKGRYKLRKYYIIYKRSITHNSWRNSSPYRENSGQSNI